MCESPTETGLYYLQSRYYDPEICRFINADVMASIGQSLIGGNTFAYCFNRPVIYKDSLGNEPDYTLDLNEDGQDEVKSVIVCKFLQA